MTAPLAHNRARLYRQSRLRSGLVCAAVIAIGLAVPLPGRQAAAQSAPARPAGERIYVDQGCAVCHGLMGKGGVGSALVGDKFLVMSDYVATQILLGRGQMPGFAGRLSDAQIAAVASYIRDSWGNGFGHISAQQVQQQRAKLSAKP